MKKLLFALSLLIASTAVLTAQDGKKLMRQASRDLSSFNLDPSGNQDKLASAASNITEALQDPEMAADAGAWNVKGDIFSQIATQTIAFAQLGQDPGGLPKVEDPAYQAFEAYMKGYELAEKRFETRDALKGLFAVQGPLSQMGIQMYEQEKDYEGAFNNFKAVLEAHKVLKENKDNSMLDKEEDYYNQLYITGLAALNSNKLQEAEPLFNELMASNFDKPLIYEAMYRIEEERSGPEAAYKYIEQGREKFPDEVSLLFADINYHLKTNRLDELIGKLEAAIEKEPENVSLYSTLGNVYDNLYQRETEAGNDEKAQEYFDKAKSYYEQALERDPDNFDATYSIGVLYYNKAAAMTTEMQTLADDYSKEGLKRYEELQEKMFAQFDKALPWFKKCEQLNPNDLNTLIALREIHAKKNELEVSEEFKRRIEVVQGGGTNEDSYYK
jgi:tetratricopeptide (TPR) repeat protein